MQYLQTIQGLFGYFGVFGKRRGPVRILSVFFFFSSRKCKGVQSEGGLDLL